MANTQPIVGLFRSDSWVSKAIRFQTRSPYSHCGIFIGSRFWEAWHWGGVRRIKLGDPPVKGEHGGETQVDLFYYKEPLPAEDVISLRQFLDSMVGFPYDFRSVLRFVSRRPASKNGRLFCSEYVLAAFEYIGVPLLHLEPHHGSPRDVRISPLLYQALETITWDDWRQGRRELEVTSLWDADTVARFLWTQ